MLKIFYSPDSQAELKGGSGNPAGSNDKKGSDIVVNDKPVRMPNDTGTGQEILERAGYKPVTCYSLYMKLAGCDFEKVSLTHEINFKNPGLENFVTKDPDVFPYSVNQDSELTQEKELAPRAIIKLAGLDPEKVYLVQVTKHGEEVLAFKMDEPVCMDCKGLVFLTREWIETVDIEEYGKECKPVPPAKNYLIKVDKEKFSWPNPIISVEQVIKFVQKDNPSNFNLVKFLSNTPKPIPLPYNETIDLRVKCLLRFVVQPKTQNDGFQRGFSLPEEDIDFLKSVGFRWEALAEISYMWLLIHDYPLPDGYTVKNCTLALMIPPNYPATEIDMAYFYPQLIKSSGKTIGATTNQPIGGKVFQRWSRHRLPNEWKPGVDNVATHLTLVDNWLKNDINR
ncbi:MAG: E2/UBC family protein [Chitinophagaceae bacterium]